MLRRALAELLDARLAGRNDDDLWQDARSLIERGSESFTGLSVDDLSDAEMAKLEAIERRVRDNK